MKKRLSMLLAVTIFIMLVLSGCSSKEASGDKGASTSIPKTEKDEKAKDKYKIMYIVSVNLGDKSFNDSGMEGLRKAEEDFGVEVSVVELSGDTSKYEPTVLDASESDVDLIIVSAGGTSEAVLEFADQYPDKNYICFDLGPEVEINHPNVYGITFKQNEASFLAGAVGSKISKTGVLGFVGGVENPTINDFLVGYISGAQEANPDVKVGVSYVGNWADAAKGKELSFAQIMQGADVIHGVAGGAGLGVIDAAKEKKIWALGVDSDQSLMFVDTDPEKADRIVTSALKNVGGALYNSIELALDGKLNWGNREHLGIKEGAIGIAKNKIYKKSVDEDVRKWIDELEEKIVSGEIVVPSAFTMDNQEFNNLKNSVNP